MTLPAPIARHLSETRARDRALAYLHLTAEGRLLEAGGELAVYGLADLARGDDVSQRLPFLVGLTPLPARYSLDAVSWHDHTARVEILPADDGVWLLLEARELEGEQRRQAETNRLSLQRASLEGANRALGIYLAGTAAAVFEVLPNGYLALAPAPAWVAAVWAAPWSAGDVLDDLGEVLLLFDSFRADAEAVWQGPDDAQVSSGPWLQPGRGPDATELPLEAVALRSEGLSLLCVRHLGDAFEQQQRLLQLAREKRLLLDELRRETQIKDVVAHCIVHDLMSPLTAMRCSLELVDEDLSEGDLRELIEAGRSAAVSQERLIRSILDVFRAEGTFEPVDPQRAPKVREVFRAVQASLRPLCQSARVTLEFDESGLPAEAVRLHAERSRLERVLVNLAENAIRLSPPGSPLRLVAAVEGPEVLIAVDDEGPGVDPEKAAALFEKFHQGGGRGKIGLGLYFCRTMVEQWGGQIGCQPRSAGGSRFWFRLPRVSN